MSATLKLHRAGPALTIQDLGRPGYIVQGLSAGGAADRLALFEATALLGLPEVAPAIEMAGLGGKFSVGEAVRFALTGAPMQATLDGAPIRWNATHRLEPGQRLAIGGALAGSYGYLTFAGGIDSEPWLGSRSAHLAAGIDRVLAGGDTLPLGPDPRPEAAPVTLTPEERFAGGTVRLMPGTQSGLFSDAVMQRFLASEFKRDAGANRQGIRLLHTGGPFDSPAAAGLASDFITPGDVQMTGDGIPYVLMSECQTVGGYPRIGTVLPDDLPRVAQAPLGATLRFVALSLADADRLYRTDAERLRALRAAVRPLVRDPHGIHDLLGYQLIGGVTCGDDLERA